MMKRAFFPTALVVAFFSAGFFAGQEDAYYFKVNKSLEKFGSVFRQISEQYVDEIDPETFVQAGIDGMLETLDPYTVYMDENGSGDIDLLTTGAYTGLGISVGVRDSMLTIMDLYDGYSAQTSGIRIGDRILQIDTAMVLYKASDALRPYTRGEAGSKVNVRILRDGVKDTLDFLLTRSEIKVNNIPYAGVMENGVGYIKLERFSRKSAQEVRTAIATLKSQQKLNGLVLDLRDNPGGLLDAAVSLCEIFVPEGSVIVSTRGKDPEESRIYRSNRAPSEPELPLAVMVNNRSASASEIVAGAIQDLDRGIIIGERSFGKGLVQTVFPMPHNASLKITTARYYTPSGRSIQQIDYASKRKGVKVANSDTTIFHTKNNRTVFELNGITPDSTVAFKREYPDFVREVLKRGLVFGFASQYTAKMDKLPADFVVNSAVLKEFEQFLKAKKFNYNSNSLIKTEELKTLAEKEKYSGDILKEIEKLEKLLKNSERNPVQQNAAVLTDVLQDEIASRFQSNSATFAATLKNDSQLQTAIELLKEKPKYEALLTAAEVKGGF
ncbi:MAG TPA: S41 family peptidase [Patescibacteria group bacterium]|nr:S41 family peptidase [Patescibacteria group bacterium]